MITETEKLKITAVFDCYKAEQESRNPSVYDIWDVAYLHRADAYILVWNTGSTLETNIGFSHMNTAKEVATELHRNVLEDIIIKNEHEDYLDRTEYLEKLRNKSLRQLYSLDISDLKPETQKQIRQAAEFVKNRLQGTIPELFL